MCYNWDVCQNKYHVMSLCVLEKTSNDDGTRLMNDKEEMIYMLLDGG